MQVTPLAITLVNWKAVQNIMPSSNCLSDLKNAGISKEDPAAIGVLFQGKDPWTPRFIFVQFLVSVPSWDPQPMAIDQFQVSKSQDETVLILSGTADNWITQFRREPTSNTTRSKVFQTCKDQLSLTGLKRYINA